MWLLRPSNLQLALINYMGEDNLLSYCLQTHKNLCSYLIHRKKILYNFITSYHWKNFLYKLHHITKIFYTTNLISTLLFHINILHYNLHLPYSIFFSNHHYLYLPHSTTIKSLSSLFNLLLQPPLSLSSSFNLHQPHHISPQFILYMFNYL